MSGTKAGGAQAAKTNKTKYGETFYADIGAVGGAKSRGGGFAYWKANGMSDKISAAGKKGGTISRRPKRLLDGE